MKIANYSYQTLILWKVSYKLQEWKKIVLDPDWHIEQNTSGDLPLHVNTKVYNVLVVILFSISRHILYSYISRPFDICNRKLLKHDIVLKNILKSRFHPICQENNQKVLVFMSFHCVVLHLKKTSWNLCNIISITLQHQWVTKKLWNCLKYISLNHEQTSHANIFDCM